MPPRVTVLVQLILSISLAGAACAQQPQVVRYHASIDTVAWRPRTRSRAPR